MLITEPYAAMPLYAPMSLAPEGYIVSGEITSYGSDTDAVTVRVFDSSNIEITSFTTTSGTYSVTISSGEYVLEFSKDNHVTRRYDISINDMDVLQDVKICLLGDVTGDGKVTLGDYGKVLSHVKKKSLLNGYSLLCADVTRDSKVTLGDYGKILSHVKQKTLLW